MQSISHVAIAALLLGAVVPLRNAGAQASPCPPLDSTAPWARISRSWSNEAGVRWSNDSLRRVLLALHDRDQAARAAFGARVKDTLYVRQLVMLDSTLAADMSRILDRFGLPTRDLVGPAGSDAAMLIVQHNWRLQERVLALAMTVPPGQISLEKLGMLEDRVLVHRGQPQRFGTQFTIGPDGVFRFAPVSDTVGLDARRAAAGMPPLSQYVCLLDEAGMKVDRSSLPSSRRPWAAFPSTPHWALLRTGSVASLVIETCALYRTRQRLVLSGFRACKGIWSHHLRAVTFS